VLVLNSDDPEQWETIHDTKQMEQHLLQQSRKHFSQAHGTPFTVKPLKTLLAKDGMSEFGESIYRGEPIPPEHQILEHTRLLLQHQKSLLPPHTTHTEKPLEFEALMSGFRKWPEQTTTSPSG